MSPPANTDVIPGINPASHTVLGDLQRKYVARTPHMREIGLTVTALKPGRGAMSLPGQTGWVTRRAAGCTPAR